MLSPMATVLDSPQQILPHSWIGFRQPADPYRNQDVPFSPSFWPGLAPSIHSEQIRDGNRNSQLTKLQTRYIMSGDEGLIASILGEHSSLYLLLIEAVEPLRQAFGEARIFRLRAEAFDDDRMLRALVQLPSCFRDPESALRSFDSAWWLDNCHRSGGTLVFDYEIQDAV